MLYHASVYSQAAHAIFWQSLAQTEVQMSRYWGPHIKFIFRNFRWLWPVGCDNYTLMQRSCCHAVIPKAINFCITELLSTLHVNSNFLVMRKSLDVVHELGRTCSPVHQCAVIAHSLTANLDRKCPRRNSNLSPKSQQQILVNCRSVKFHHSSSQNCCAKKL